MNPLVSFVVPCYKLAHLLPECVHSILAQTYPDFEILIMDNCSPDNTPEVAASFNDPRVKHIRNEANIGHVRNFNKGITMASGKYVWLVSPDDGLRSPDVLKRYVDVMERNPGVGYVFCRAIEVRGSKELGLAHWTNCGERDRIWDGRRFLMGPLRRGPVVLCSVMVRKECYHEAGLFSLEMPHANDWYLWFVIALRYQVAYMSEPMVSVRVHEESLTSEFNRGGTAFCTIDELTVLWRVARLAELAGVVSVRQAFNATIARLAARALKYGFPWSPRARLSEADFEVLLRQYVKDSKDEEDLRVRLCMSVGDEEFWHGQYKEAALIYWQGLRLRPWWLGSWAKYLLLRTGGVGVRIRRSILGLRQPGTKVI
jgi:hypothetical protein